MPINANKKLDKGPAAATLIVSILKLLNLLGFTGTGLAHPNPAKNISNVPIGSKCFIGFSVNLPNLAAVSSPHLYATNAWLNSWIQNENIIDTDKIINNWGLLS